MRGGNGLFVDDDAHFLLRSWLLRCPSEGSGALCRLASNEAGWRRDTSKRRRRRCNAPLLGSSCWRWSRVPAESLANIADFLGLLEFV